MKKVSSVKVIKDNKNVKICVSSFAITDSSRSFPILNGNFIVEKEFEHEQYANDFYYSAESYFYRYNVRTLQSNGYLTKDDVIEYMHQNKERTA